MKRKYPEKLTDIGMKKVKFFLLIFKIRKLYVFQNKKREKGVPFVVTYHPDLNSLIHYSPVVFLYPLKTSVQGVEKRCIGNK